MDELILILRLSTLDKTTTRLTRQTNNSVYVTDDGSEHCALIDIFQQERTLVIVTIASLKTLVKSYLILKYLNVFV